MVSISLPDGSVKQFAAAPTGLEVAQSIGTGLAKAALAIKVDGELRDLTRRIEGDARIEIVTGKSPEALPLLRHDAAHVLAEAVQELWPDVQITFGPATEDGFYYDFHRAAPFSPDDFATIEAKMREIVDRDEAIEREIWDHARMKAHFQSHGETFKAEWVDAIPAGEAI
jgi:threonyl-tRNA synthetase